jgi:hypothetical protein
MSRFSSSYLQATCTSPPGVTRTPEKQTRLPGKFLDLEHRNLYQAARSKPHPPRPTLHQTSDSCRCWQNELIWCKEAKNKKLTRAARKGGGGGGGRGKEGEGREGKRGKSAARAHQPPRTQLSAAGSEAQDTGNFSGKPSVQIRSKIQLHGR